MAWVHFRITGPLEGNWWIPTQSASNIDEDLNRFLRRFWCWKTVQTPATHVQVKSTPSTNICICDSSVENSVITAMHICYAINSGHNKLDINTICHIVQDRSKGSLLVQTNIPMWLILLFQIKGLLLFGLSWFVKIFLYCNSFVVF